MKEDVEKMIKEAPAVTFFIFMLKNIYFIQFINCIG